MQAETISVQDIDELTDFLPRFEAVRREYVVRWGGGETLADGAVTVPYPIYADDVWRFFQLAGQPRWSDYDYVPNEAAKMLADDGFIESASLEEVKTMLTYCVRGERFCDGHWAAMLESGRVSALLRRLSSLRPVVVEVQGSPGRGSFEGEP